MSKREIDRIQIIDQVLEWRLSVNEASRQIGVSRRQLIRLVSAYRKQGAEAISSKKEF